MDAPQSLDALFKQKLFRIPDYQRGYAWQEEQLKAFWEDLVSLPDERSHYTGVLTLKARAANTIKSDSNEFWLVDDHSYHVFDIVDGQQRLTTFIVFVQAILACVRALPENADKPNAAIYLTESLNLTELEKKYLFEIKPTGGGFRTYKFGYATDNPSYLYLRHRILGEEGGGTIEETFYTLNLNNALRYFGEQLQAWHLLHGIAGLQDIYRRLTKRFLFNEYIIKDEFDVFVAFETMNNRGKQLSDLEKLKNRLIYLTTLYTDLEMDPSDRRSLRDAVNDAWKEVYHQLGRNRTHPLNDDDFLRAHWTMYFKYSRQTGRDYIHFLLDEQFSPHRVHRKIVHAVELESAKELRTNPDGEEADAETPDESAEQRPTAELRAQEIRDYVISLKESAVHWFHSYFPETADHLLPNEREWLARLNRVGIGYFRPLVMAALKSVKPDSERVELYQWIERFIVIAFRLGSAKANYGSSEFINAARLLDSGEWTVLEACSKIAERLAYAFNEDRTFNCTDFHSLLAKRFASGSGYYGWSGIRYFLYEYELSLLEDSRQKKVDWSDLLRSEKDMVSIEHIYPQTETAAWSAAFPGLDDKARIAYGGSLGNLLLLSRSINSSLQNDSFAEKKNPRFDGAKKKIRNGYSDGSHSEIEVAQSPDWGPSQIHDRGLRLLRFMETRWNIRLRDDDRERLLFLTQTPA
jgi:hypothetical protein